VAFHPAAFAAKHLAKDDVNLVKGRQMATLIDIDRQWWTVKVTTAPLRASVDQE
jgi:hypothetical protein